MQFQIDPDIRQAHTPPSRIYTDDGIYRACIDKIFARSWQFVADLDDVRIPGQVFPFTLLDGCLNEPLLLTRDAADRLSCISNVCTHRGNLVCEHPGNERFLRCRYHGRRFALDGKFEQMPEFDQTANFPAASDNLAKVPFEQWDRLFFASLDPHAPFAEVAGPMRQHVGWMPLAQSKPEPARNRDYLVRCNWALYVENYLEGFHIPFVHSGLAEKLDFGRYRTDLFRYGSVQVGVAKSGEPCFEIPPAAADRGAPPSDHGQRIAAYYYWVFPNTMFNFYSWGLSINVVRPLAVDRTKVSFITYVWDPAKLDSGAGTGLDRVEREDEAIVETVQRGVQSRIYTCGRYSPTREQGTHHFHRLLAEFLT